MGVGMVYEIKEVVLKATGYERQTVATCEGQVPHVGEYVFFMSGGHEVRYKVVTVHWIHEDGDVKGDGGNVVFDVHVYVDREGS